MVSNVSKVVNSINVVPNEGLGKSNVLGSLGLDDGLDGLGALSSARMDWVNILESRLFSSSNEGRSSDEGEDTES